MGKEIFKVHDFKVKIRCIGSLPSYCWKWIPFLNVGDRVHTLDMNMTLG